MSLEEPPREKGDAWQPPRVPGRPRSSCFQSCFRCKVINECLVTQPPNRTEGQTVRQDARNTVSQNTHTQRPHGPPPAPQPGTHGSSALSASSFAFFPVMPRAPQLLQHR